MKTVFLEVDIWKCLEKEPSKVDVIKYYELGFIKYYALLTYLLPMFLTLIGNTIQSKKKCTWCKNTSFSSEPRKLDISNLAYGIERQSVIAVSIKKKNTMSNFR